MKYYVEELNQEFKTLRDAEKALAEEIKKDGWELVFIIKVGNTYCYASDSIKPRKCPYSVPGYTIVKRTRMTQKNCLKAKELIKRKWGINVDDFNDIDIYNYLRDMVRDMDEDDPDLDLIIDLI